VKVTVVAIPVVIGSFEIGIRDPGTIRHVAFERKPKLVMTQGEPNFEEVPVLFVEGRQGAPIRKHKYVVINHGEWCDPDDHEEATWVATGLSGGGLVVHIFEITERPS